MPRLGTSDLDLYPLALGTNTFGWTSDRSTSHAVLDAFVAGRRQLRRHRRQLLRLGAR